MTHLVVHVMSDLMEYVAPVPLDVNSVSLLSRSELTLQTLHLLRGENPFRSPKKVGRIGGIGIFLMILLIAQCWLE